MIALWVQKYLCCPLSPKDLTRYLHQMTSTFEIFLATQPGLELDLTAEAARHGFADPKPTTGGVVVLGGWHDVWRANIHLRCATRVLVRLTSFRAFHLAQLDKRARKLPWTDWLPLGARVKIEATTHASKIYHAKAAAQRIDTALRAALGDPRDTAELRILARIDDDLVTLSLDTSGEPLHRRGHKVAVGKAPLRESMAAAFLARMGYDGSQPILDPMCGSGTIPLEAAELAKGLRPGRSRSFHFECLPSADADEIANLRSPAKPAAQIAPIRGQDRDDGVIAMARQNAQRADVADLIDFARMAITTTERPEGPPGLILVNPPYGARIGNRKLLFALYGSFGALMQETFGGWRVGLVTSDKGLARATGLKWLPPTPPISHGSLKVQFYQTGPL